MLNNDQHQKVSEWFEAKKQLDEIKALEISLRNEISQYFGTAPDFEGTETIDLGEGFKLKKSSKLTYSCDPIERIEEALGQIDFNKYPSAIGIFRFKPELSVSTYRSLPDEVKTIVDSVITSKTATPSLEISVPKGKK